MWETDTQVDLYSATWWAWPRERELGGTRRHRAGAANPARDGWGQGQSGKMPWKSESCLASQLDCGLLAVVSAASATHETHGTQLRQHRFRPPLRAHWMKERKGLLPQRCTASSISKGLQLLANHKRISVHNADSSHQIAHHVQVGSPVPLEHLLSPQGLLQRPTAHACPINMQGMNGELTGQELGFTIVSLPL